MKPIIASTDFSPVSLNAVNYAADLACALNRSLYLIHISQLPIVYSEVPVTISNVNDLMNEAGEKLKNLKEDISARTGEKIEINTDVIVGSVVNEIENLCEAVDPSYVVMGSQDAGALERMLWGSN